MKYTNFIQKAGMVLNIIKNTILKKTFKAFSLLEVAISLAIIGVLTMAVIKGQDLLYQARIDKTVTQIESIKLSIESFRSTYGQLPGDYDGSDLAISKKGGNRGFIIEAQNDAFWEHLEAAGLLTKKQSVPAIGGVFSVVYNPEQNLQGNWIKLAKSDGSGLMDSKDAIAFKVKIDGTTNNNEGSVRIRNGVGNGACVNTNTGQITPTKAKVCIFYIAFP